MPRLMRGCQLRQRMGHEAQIILGQRILSIGYGKQKCFLFFLVIAKLQKDLKFSSCVHLNFSNFAEIIIYLYNVFDCKLPGS